MIINPYVFAATIDSDAQAFITAAGITDSTQQSAINTLVVSLKGYNIWTKFKAIYPIVGGVASSHAVNLKTPGTYNLTFATGVTHSSTGMLSNGTSGYADTFLNPSSILSLNSTHISFYSGTNTNNTTIEIGTGLSDGLFIEARTSGISYYRINSTTLLQHNDANSLGFYVANRTASNIANAWKNGVKQITSTGASTSLPVNNIFLLALNNSIAQYFTTKQCRFSTIGDGLSDTEAANFYTAVQAYQTTLGRQV